MLNDKQKENIAFFAKRSAEEANRKNWVDSGKFGKDYISTLVMLLDDDKKEAKELYERTYKQYRNVQKPEYFK